MKFISKVAAALLLLQPPSMLADHLPPKLVARGPSERVLASINVYRSKLPEVLRILGKPANEKHYPEVEDRAEVTWTKAGSVVHANVDVNDIAFAIKVSGTPSGLTKTGRGLALGANITDARRIYGNRLMRRGDDVTFQWSDGTELRLHLDHDHIDSMMLVTSDE